MGPSGNYSTFEKGLETSRKKLLDSLAGASDITFFYSSGNMGDQLIWAGTKKLLSSIRYESKYFDRTSEIKDKSGHTAIITGGGAFCKPYQHMAAVLPFLEERYQRVIVFPGSFDPSVEAVRRSLAKSKATVFARELVSYKLIKNLCHAELAYDCAFFYDFQPYKRPGTGTLNAFREDPERNTTGTPPGNNDISSTCRSLGQWFDILAKHETIRTDRAHVMVAGAMLGKKVYYGSSYYHKVPAIAEFSLKGFPVHPLPG